MEVLRKVQEIGLSATAKLVRFPSIILLAIFLCSFCQVNIQYNTISNWVNIAKGGHDCHFCGRTYPWKAALERHIKQQHEVEIKYLKKNCLTRVSGWWRRWCDIKGGYPGDPLPWTLQGRGGRFCQSHISKRCQRKVSTSHINVFCSKYWQHKLRTKL